MSTADEHVAARRAAVDAAIADGDPIAARALLAQLWRLRPAPATAAFVLGRSARLGPGPRTTTARVAVLRSCTVEPLIPLLRAGAAVADLDLEVTVGGYGTYAQEILDPASTLYGDPSPDVVVLFTHLRDVAPELWRSFDPRRADLTTEATRRTITHMTSLVRTFRAASRAELIVHSFDVPVDRALGLADDAAALGQAHAIATIGDALRELVAATPGVHLLDYDRIVADLGRRSWYDDARWAAVGMPFRTPALVALADEWVRAVTALAGRSAKVVVVDLDDTLWAGVVGEDGASGVRVTAAHRALQHALRDLTARGILLAVASKNNPSDVARVWERPDMVLRPEDFSAMRIGWDAKADSLRSIAAELDVGLDALCFLDDNPVECDLVRRSLPEVAVLQVDVASDPDASIVRRDPRLERLVVTADDARRAQQYDEQRRRRETLDALGDLDAHLASLQTWVRITPLGDADVERAAQLTRKTNQCNLTTRRYGEPEVAAFASDGEHAVYVVAAGDRFGEHGTIGLAIVRTSTDAWELDTFLLSCRVIGRGIETALLARIVDDARRRGAVVLRAELVPTAKNAPAARILPDHGFTPPAEDERWWTLALAGAEVPVPHWIAERTAEEM